MKPQVKKGVQPMTDLPDRSVIAIARYRSRSLLARSSCPTSADPAIVSYMKDQTPDTNPTCIFGHPSAGDSPYQCATCLSYLKSFGMAGRMGRKLYDAYEKGSPERKQEILPFIRSLPGPYDPRPSLPQMVKITREAGVV